MLLGQVDNSEQTIEDNMDKKFKKYQEIKYKSEMTSTVETNIVEIIRK